MIWYIAGPMTGIEDWNYPAFHEAERWLREHFPGDEIINPATCFDGNTTLPREHYMRAALVNVAKCDALLLLPGWDTSIGACTEIVAYCGSHSEQIIAFHDGEPGDYDTESLALETLQNHCEPWA